MSIKYKHARLPHLAGKGAMNGDVDCSLVGIAKPIVMLGMEFVFRKIPYPPHRIYYSTIEAEAPILVIETDSVTATYKNARRKLVRLSDGTLYTIYPKKLDLKWQIYIKKSTNGGLTWADETCISIDLAGYNQYNPCIAVDSNDHLHVVWHGYSLDYTPYTQIWYVKYDGSWSAPARISHTDVHHRYASITVDSNDYLHAVWGGYGICWYTKFVTSWSAPIQINADASIRTPEGAGIVSDSNNHLHVVYTGKKGSGEWQIWYILYNGSWQSPVRISTYPDMWRELQEYPCVAVDSNNHVHVVFCGYQGFLRYGIWYTKYTTSWSEPIKIIDMKNYSIPNIGIDSNDYLYAITSGRIPIEADHEIWYVKYVTSWSTPESIEDGSTPSIILLGR